jgi:hypothetical protein
MDLTTVKSMISRTKKLMKVNDNYLKAEIDRLKKEGKSG